MGKPDCNVRLLAFPSSIDGVTVPNDDGSFDIYINSKLPAARQQEKLAHELLHISKDHFYDDRSIVIREQEANSRLEISVL